MGKLYKMIIKNLDKHVCLGYASIDNEQRNGSQAFNNMTFNCRLQDVGVMRELVFANVL